MEGSLACPWHAAGALDLASGPAAAGPGASGPAAADTAAAVAARMAADQMMMLMMLMLLLILLPAASGAWLSLSVLQALGSRPCQTQQSPSAGTMAAGTMAAVGHPLGH